MNIVNLDAVRRAHRRVLAQTKTALAEAATDAGQFAVDYVHAHPTFTPRTGHLQDSTSWKTVRLSSGRVVRVENRAKYAAAIDRGAKPHVIEARRGKTLAFTKNGKLMFRRRVNHPGNKPTKFLYRATSAAGRILYQGMSNKMAKIAAKF